MPSFRPIFRLSLLLLLGFTLGSAAEPTAFPLKVGPSRRYLVDQQDRPFLYHADTAWMLFTKLTVPEASEYLTRRQAQGFNVVQVHLTGFLGMTNRQGHLPFAGTPPAQRFDQPNEAFFASVDQVVEAAERMGLCLLSGGMGQAYGSPNWNFPENWRAILEQPGGISLGHLRRLFESRPWWTLIPDRDHQLTREGHGTFATNNYVTSARTEDN